MVTWAECRHIFAWDEELLDISVPGAGQEGWARLLALLRSGRYQTATFVDSAPAELPQDAAAIFALRDAASPLLEVRLGPVRVHCHFFTPDAVELDIAAGEVAGPAELALLLGLLADVGEALGRDVVLTPESAEETVLLRYDAAAREVVAGERLRG